MIAGIFIRNYKAFSGLNFIRLTNSHLDPLQISIGNNGVGKSSILEAIDAFFNNRKWNPHKDAKHDDVYCAPIFLIHKGRNSIKYLDEMSTHLWDCTEETLPPILKSQRALADFFSFRDEIIANNPETRNTHWLLICGTKYTDPDHIFFGAFDHTIKKHFENNSIPTPTQIKNFICNRYTYLYLPVETGVRETLQLDNVALQTMAGKKLTEEIDKILKERSIELIKDGRKNKLSIVELISFWLDNFLESINSTAKTANQEYQYKNTGRIKNLKASDIRHDVIEAFFTKRTLFKGDRSIDQLSSGEKRAALVDLASCFLSSETSKNKNYILAIDEPESSMHTAICFDQFEKLANLSKKLNRQVLITTHWYGLVPMLQLGTLCHISKNPKPSAAFFNMRDLLENRGDFPDDIEMKSYFDLVASIITIMKHKKTNWIICEGADDAKYLEHYLKNSIEDLKIIPVGGASIVIKLFNYLFAPLSEKTEQNTLNGKILCLIDTDIQTADFEGMHTNKKGTIALRRWQVSLENGINKVNLGRLTNEPARHPIIKGCGHGCSAGGWPG